MASTARNMFWSHAEDRRSSGSLFYAWRIKVCYGNLAQNVKPLSPSGSSSSQVFPKASKNNAFTHPRSWQRLYSEFGATLTGFCEGQAPDAFSILHPPIDGPDQPFQNASENRAGSCRFARILRKVLRIKCLRDCIRCSTRILCDLSRRGQNVSVLLLLN